MPHVKEKRYFLRALALLALTGVLIGCGGGGGGLSLGERRLRVAMISYYPPFIVYNRDSYDPFQGFDPDLLDLIIEYADLNVEYVRSASVGILDELNVGRWDMVMSGFAINESHTQIAAFSEPYHASSLVVVVRTDETRIDEVDDLSAGALLVGVQEYSTGEEAAHDVIGVPEGSLRVYETLDDLMLGIRFGSIDAVVMSGPVAWDQVDLYGDIRILKQPVLSERYGIAVRKSDLDLKAALDRAITALREDGTLAELKAEHNLH
jgi:polar amino acid transport system substrate-binding protein